MRAEVERTIAECEAEVEELQRRIDQRRFVVRFLREFLDTVSRDTVSRNRGAPASRDRGAPTSSTSSSITSVPPVPPVRLRHRVQHAQQLPRVQQVERTGTCCTQTGTLIGKKIFVKKSLA